MKNDWFDALVALLDAKARFLVVGAHAMAVHGVPRGTQDLDLWVDPIPENVERVWRALTTFGAPLGSLGISPVDLSRPGMVIQLGLPPNRIDLLTSLSGIPDFSAAWNARVEHLVRGRLVPFLSRDHLIANKRAVGRPKDRIDLDALEQ